MLDLHLDLGYISFMPLAIVPVEQIPAPDQLKPTPSNLMELYKVCMEMQAICEKEKGIGLSAVQVGIPWRLFIVKWPDKYGFYVNCEYQPIGDERSASIEGCLSLRNASGNLRNFKLERWKRVLLKGDELDIEKLVLKPIKIELDGMYAVVMQHEIDHELGILLSNIGIEISLW